MSLLEYFLFGLILGLLGILLFEGYGPKPPKPTY